MDAHDPFFVPVSAPAFTRELIADLAAGRCAAVQVPGLLPAGVCAEVLDALSRADFASYQTERIYPPVMRFGVGVSDHRPDGELTDGYWDAVEDARKSWQELGLDVDPFLSCREALAADWPGTIDVARRGGREMGPGVAREPNQGFQVHYDDALREFKGDLLDVNLVAQFAFNLYLSVAESGGETVIWRHRWHPDDEAYRLPHSYGYAADVVDGYESFELRPSVGEALLLDPRNFHAVRPSTGGRRIALGFAVGLSDTGDLYTWG